MKRVLLLAFLLAGPPRGPYIPGMPDWCCGYRECRRAHVRVLRRGKWTSEAVVNGVRMTVPAGKTPSGKTEGSWYCFDSFSPKCRAGKISADCAVCIIEGVGRVRGPRVIRLAGAAPAGHLVLPAGGCAWCHH